MAVMHRLVHQPPSRVWDVLSDGDRYATWVVGTQDAWEEKSEWPREGATLGYRLKLGPWSYEGTTVVRICEPQRRLEMEAMAGKVGSARIAIELLPWGEETLVIVDEHPLRGRNNSMHNAAIDAVVHLRHRSMLRRLARAAEGEGPRTRADT